MDRSDTVRKVVQGFGERLNLMPHLCSPVGGNIAAAAFTSFLCGDIEVHQIEEKFCILDCHRVFPPTAPPSNEKMAYLWKLFRPEFVAK